MPRTRSRHADPPILLHRLATRVDTLTAMSGYQYHPFELHQVEVRDPFWLAWQHAVSRKGLNHQWKMMEQTHRLERFRLAARKEPVKVGYVFDDSDLYKWVEAASYALKVDPQTPVRPLIDQAVELIRAAQDPDGYLDTRFQHGDTHLKWRDLGMNHEMYCAGHLIEAAIAHHQASGTRDLLDVAIRFADHIADLFGPGKRKGYCGHEEIELALAALGRHLGESRYIELAKWMVDTRGSRPSPFEEERNDPVVDAFAPFGKKILFKDDVYDGAYLQDDKPLREQDTAVGHAVRAMYLFCGAVDTHAEHGDPQTLQALERIWENLVRRRMYLTGGIGSSGNNEGFTADFDLPNRDAYAETCAGIGFVLWSWRMGALTGQSQYADELERGLYNGMLSGIGLEGDSYFYVNPLESRGDHLRKPWFPCACCPPNIARAVLSVARFVGGASHEGVWINIPFSCKVQTAVQAIPLSFEVESNYPWDGSVCIRLEPSSPTRFALRIRKPAWANEAEVSFNGTVADFRVEGGYLVLERLWQPGDQIDVLFPMEPTWVQADPRVWDTLGRTALKRGPLVYCLEEADLASPVEAIAVDTTTTPTLETVPNPRWAVNLMVEGTLDNPDWPHPKLYIEHPPAPPAPCKVRFVPYMVWANRTPGSMQVWVRRKP